RSGVAAEVAAQAQCRIFMSTAGNQFLASWAAAELEACLFEPPTPACFRITITQQCRNRDLRPSQLVGRAGDPAKPENLVKDRNQFTSRPGATPYPPPRRALPPGPRLTALAL